MRVEGTHAAIFGVVVPRQKKNCKNSQRERHRNLHSQFFQRDAIQKPADKASTKNIDINVLRALPPELQERVYARMPLELRCIFRLINRQFLQLIPLKKFCVQNSEELALLVKRHEDIESLDLSRWENLTDDDLTLLKKFKKLKELNLSEPENVQNFRENISDEAIKTLTDLPLEILRLNWCSNLTNSAIAFLPRTLKILEAHCCVQFTEEIIQHLPPKLAEADFTNCPDLDGAARKK